MVLVDNGAGIYRRPPTLVPTETDVSMEASGGDRNFPLSTNSTLNWFVPQHQAPGGPVPPPASGRTTWWSPKGLSPQGPTRSPGQVQTPQDRSWKATQLNTLLLDPLGLEKLCGPPTKVLETWDKIHLPENTASWNLTGVRLSVADRCRRLLATHASPAPVRDRSFPPMRLQRQAQLCPRHRQWGSMPTPSRCDQGLGLRWVPTPGHTRGASKSPHQPCRDHNQAESTQSNT